MAWSSATYITSFDAEAGAVSTLATDAQKRLWFNEGQARLNQWLPAYADISWSAADRTKAVPTGFIALQKIITDDGDVVQPWRVHGSVFVIDDPNGASAAGAARVYYWKDWTALTDVVSSVGSSAQDYACLYYALSRFYRLLSSNRAYYKRYATIVGANAVTMSDLQQEADRYYQDFLDARNDQQPLPPAYYYES